MAYRLNLVVSSDAIYEMRIASEISVQHPNNHEFKYSDMINELYHRILCLNKFEQLNMEKDSFIEVCFEEEIKIENEHQYLNHYVVEEIRKLYQMNKKIYVLSDFYLDSKYIALFLREKGIDTLFDGIIVSCEESVNKAQGQLYDLIKKRFVLNGTESYMIGDNYRSDILQARKHGFTTVHIRTKVHKSLDSRKILTDKMCKEKQFGMSYANYAFLFYRYISLLYTALKKEGLSGVFFFSREGELLKKFFDLYCDVMKRKFGLPAIESHYLYVSRQATYAASLNDLASEDFHVLFHQYPNQSIDTFLMNLGFDVYERKFLKENIPLDFDVVVDDLCHSSQFSLLKENTKFISLYSEKISQSKHYLCEYLRQNGFFTNKKVAIVDVGWKGTIQDNISKCLQREQCIIGYYCGLSKDAETNAENRKEGLLFSEYPKRSLDLNIWSFDAGFWERLLTASHPSVKGYTLENDKIIPLFNDFGTEEDNFELMKPIQNQMFKLFKELCEMICDIPALDTEIEEVIREIHIKTCCCVGKSNMILKTQLLNGQMENFGAQTNYGQAYGDRFTMRHILSKLKHNLRKIKNPLLITTVLCNRGLFGLSAYILRIQGVWLKRKSHELT